MELRVLQGVIPQSPEQLPLSMLRPSWGHENAVNGVRVVVKCVLSLTQHVYCVCVCSCGHCVCVVTQ